MAQKEELTLREAAALLDISTRSLLRLVDAGKISKTASGKYLASELQLLKEDPGDRDERENVGESLEQTAILELKSAYAQSVGHAERLIKLLEKPIESALSTVTGINTLLMTRLDTQEKNHLENMRFMGEFLMQKEERDALRKESAARMETIQAAGRAAMKHLPTLMNQVGGKNVLAHFAAKLNDEEKVGIGQLYWAFDEGEKRDSFAALLKVVGIEVPPNPSEESESANVN